MTVTLTNTTRRLKTLTLVHEIYCEACGRCSCSITQGRPSRRLPSSILLPAAHESAELDDAVLRLSEVARALRAAELRARHVPPRPTAPAAALRRAARPPRGEA